MKGALLFLSLLLAPILLHASDSVPRNLNVAVILAEPYDVSHVSTPITAQPCKLIPEKTYPHGHDKSFYEDFYFCVTEYYREVSKNTVNFQFTIFDNGGEWYKVTNPAKTKDYYEGRHATSLIQDILPFVSPTVAEYDAVHVKYSTGVVDAYIRAQAIPVVDDFFTFHSFISAETTDVGTDIHELGHIVGGLLTPQETFTPDLYKTGFYSRNPLNVDNVEDSHGAFDVMAQGNANDFGKTPSLMSSFTQEFLGWLQYSVYKKSDYPTFWVTALGQYDYKDAVPRYNLSESTSADASRFYVVEHRNRTVSEWDSALPGALNTYAPIYYVNTFGNSKYGYTLLGNLYAEKWTVAVPSNGILSADNPTYTDWNNLVKFSLVNARTQDGKKQIQIAISDVSIAEQTQRHTGVVLNPHEKSLTSQFGFFSMRPPNPVFFILPYIKDIFHLILCLTLVALIWGAVYMFRKKDSGFKKTLFFRLTKIARVILVIVFLVYGCVIIVNQFIIREGEACYYVNKSRTYGNYPESCAHFYPFYAPSESDVQPDLDLHAITPDGRHIGVNYQTGEYENQIAGSIVSGDNQGIHEWIFVPEGETVRYYVSARDNQAFLAENPQITDTTDTFDIYARTIDPASGIFTSETLTNQTIAPTEERAYEVGAISAEVPTVVPLGQFRE